MSDANHIVAWKDKRLSKISVWLTYGKACFDGFQIDSLTKIGLEEPWSITDGDKVTSYFYRLFLFIHNSSYICHNLQSQEIQGVSHVPKLIQVLRGRSSYVKLNSNAVRRSIIQARSWKYTPKIGFWTTWLPSRHLVYGSGSLEPLLQYNTNSRKLPTVSLFKCFTARALFPNSKSSRAILWRELLCLLQTDIGPYVFRQWVLPWSWKCGPHRFDGSREPKEWKCSELLEHWWHLKRLELVLSQQMANIWSTTS